MKNSVLKQKIIREAKRLGANLIGFAPASRWDASSEIPEAYHPKTVWSGVETIIVLGVPMLLPVIESTPSINYHEMYNTSNQLLDQAAYRLAVFINSLGYASISLPRDGYGNLEILRRKPVACFSHVSAGKYAGLGSIGLHHMLLTPQYGPRVRLVSVFTAVKISGSLISGKDLCTRCGLCARLCPAQAFTPIPGRIIAEMNKDSCTERHQQLRRESCWPCGICAKVCPVGTDRTLYKRRGVNEYIKETEALAKEPQTIPYREWEHLRAHGSETEQ